MVDKVRQYRLYRITRTAKEQKTNERRKYKKKNTTKRRVFKMSLKYHDPCQMPMNNISSSKLT